MTIKYLKDHVNNKVDDVAEVEDGLGNYLIAVGVAESVKEKVEQSKTKEKANPQPTTKNKR